MIADTTEIPNEGGPTTRELIQLAGGEASFQVTNVASWEDVDSAVGKLMADYGRLDIVVNNAAIYASKPLHEPTDEEWERVLAVNLTGMFHGCKRAVQQFRLREPANDVRGGSSRSPRGTA